MLALSALALATFAGAAAAPGGAAFVVRKPDRDAETPAQAMPRWPLDGAVIRQSPPTFSWPQTPGKTYRFELQRGGQPVLVVNELARNWLLPDSALPAGDYQWRYHTSGYLGGDTAPWQRLTIAADARPFVTPSDDALLKRAAQRARPRSLPARDQVRERARQRPAALAAFLAQLEKDAASPPAAEPGINPDGKAGALRATLGADIQRVVFGERETALNAGYAWLVTGDERWLAQARRRALNLAAWRPDGPTGFKAHDQASRAIAWTLAVLYDWLHDSWSDAERARLLAAIAPRLADFSADLFGKDYRIDRLPFDSHGANSLGQLAGICTLLAGTSPQADACLRDTVRRYVGWPTPWGRDDGGFGNGTGYALWDIAGDALPTWDILANALDIDLTRTAWAIAYPAALAYFLPPNTPRGVFGDGAEEKQAIEWAWQARALAARIPSPLADWYAAAQPADNDRLPLILRAPLPRSAPQQPPPGTPDALHLPSVGWVAMHSRLADPARQSIYFKSSPYGSFNHSHADQNSLVVNSRGEALLLDSGRYDFYDSPHWTLWYKQTRAHNAVTFDGGTGQLHNARSARGAITRFDSSGRRDIVTGDATPAYGGALTRAVRSIVYLRPDLALVSDSLASSQPRRWEWNFHSPSEPRQTGPASVEITQGPASLCITQLSGPRSVLRKSDSFDPPPQPPVPAQWHSRFEAESTSPGAHYLFLLDIGCRKPDIRVSPADAGLRVRIGADTFAFAQDGRVTEP